jgi:DNA (cytosine-5)-methyltransferase 1
MFASLPPTENRALTGEEKAAVIDRVNELLELRYRAGGLGDHDELLDSAVHVILTRNTNSTDAHRFTRELIARWGSWDGVRQATEDDLTEVLATGNLNRIRARNVLELLQQAHADTRARGWAGTTLNWLRSPNAPQDNRRTDDAGSTGEVAAYLATLPNISAGEAAAIARILPGSDLVGDPRVMRVLDRLDLTQPDFDPGPDAPGGAAVPPREPSSPTRRALDRPPADVALPKLARGHSTETLRANLVHHSRAVCHTQQPDCAVCPLISFCSTGRARHAGDGRPVAVEAFAGGGGLGEGFQRAGFDIAVAVELDRDAAQTYRLNHPGTVVVEADATQITGAQVRYLAPRADHVTAIAAGPPCQGYSAAGRRQADDSRNSLYKAVVALAAQLDPQFVVIENVPGMRRVGGESYVQAVLDELDAAGYAAAEYLLRACDYGVPQLRRRMIFLAQRASDGTAPAAPSPTHCPDPRKCRHSGGVDGACNLRPVPTVLSTLERDGLPELDAGQLAEFLPLGGGTLPVTNASTMAHSRAVTDKISTITAGAGPISYRRLHPDVARTIVAGHRALPVHPVLHRTISVREAARIQGFDDAHTFAGPRSKQPLQVANAVPPALGHAIAEQLLHLIPHAAVSEPGEPQPGGPQPSKSRPGGTQHGEITIPAAAGPRGEVLSAAPPRLRAAGR